MKKIFNLITLIVVLLIPVNECLAYFGTNTNLSNNFTTKKYSFELNANGGKFAEQDISIKNSSTVLPVPIKDGYTFLGFSESLNSDVSYSKNINNINLINNKNLYAKWKTNSYTISYNLNGGTIVGQKYNYTIEDNFTLPIPIKEGYTFAGWTGTDLNNPTQTVTISNKIGNLSYTANWNVNSYFVDVNPVLDNVQSNGGYNDYTFDVYINDGLVADNVSDWNGNVTYGYNVRVVTNEKVGHTSNFDQTITVGTGNNEIKPTWTKNTYEAHFYLDGTHRLTTYNKYSYYISTPNVTSGDLGYDNNFYYISSYTPWSTWYQPEYAVGFTINISERTCRATFGTLTTTNASAQQTKFHNAGFNYCNVNPNNNKEVVCNGSYSQVLSAYNSAWNGVLPMNGNGFSRYRDMSCDSGWSTYSNR